jgi:hypothetical protein
MRLPACLFIALCLATSVPTAQVEVVSDSFFPAELEFQELREIASDLCFEDPAHLSGIDQGLLFSDVGFQKYARRIYSTGNSAPLSIEVVTLMDSRAAFSLMTMLRNSVLKEGPPGDIFAAESGIIRFARGKHWVRIQGPGSSGDLLKRVALSVGNRIGPRRQSPPSLISHFPRTGYDASSLRYFVGPRSFKSYAITAPGGFVQFTTDMELAQARYSLQNQTGVLSLSIFPTAQVAEGYFSELGDLQATRDDGRSTHIKRTGPLIAILEGSYDSGIARQILDPIEYSYSIRWIYEKPKPKTVWGIPSAILGTVVNSLLFVVLLCLVSILLGSGYALFRVWLRGAAPRNPLDRPERTELTRLKMR